MSSLAKEETNWREAVGRNNQWKPLTPSRSTIEQVRISADNSNEDASYEQYRALRSSSEPNIFPHQYSRVSNIFSNTVLVDHVTDEDLAHTHRFESPDASLGAANVPHPRDTSALVQSFESMEDYPLDFHPVPPADSSVDGVSSPRSLSMKTVDIHHCGNADSPGDQASMAVIDIHNSPRDSAHSLLQSQLSIIPTTPLVSPHESGFLEKQLHCRSPIAENNAWRDEDENVLLTREEMPPAGQECVESSVLVDLRHQSSESLEHPGNILVDLETSQSCYSLRECEPQKTAEPSAGFQPLQLSEGWGPASPDYANRTQAIEALQRFDNNTFERKAASVVEPRPTSAQRRNTVPLFGGRPPADATYENSAKRQSWRNKASQSGEFPKQLVAAPSNSFHLATPTLVAPPLNIHQSGSSPTAPSELTPLHFTPLHTTTIDNTGRTTTVPSASPHHSAGSSLPKSSAPSWMFPRYLTSTLSSPSAFSPHAIISPHGNLVARPSRASNTAFHNNGARQLTKAAAAAQHFAEAAFFRPVGQTNILHSSSVTNRKLKTAPEKLADNKMLRAPVRSSTDESSFTETPAAAKLQFFNMAETPAKIERNGTLIAEENTKLSQGQEQELRESADAKQFAGTEKSRDMVKNNDTQQFSSIMLARTTRTKAAVASNDEDPSIVEGTTASTAAPPSTTSRTTTSAALRRAFLTSKRAPVRDSSVQQPSGINLAKKKLDRILTSTHTRLSRPSAQSHARPLGHSASERQTFRPASLRNLKGDMQDVRDEINFKRQGQQQSIVPVHRSDEKPRRHSTNGVLFSRASPLPRKRTSSHSTASVHPPGSHDDDARRSPPRSSRLYDKQVGRPARTSPQRSAIRRAGFSPRAPSFRSALKCRSVETWDIDDVRIWCVDTLELPLLAEMFFHRGVDGPQLLNMTEERLQNEFGVGRETKERLEYSLGSRQTLSRVIGHIDVILRNRESINAADGLPLSQSNLGIARREVNEEVDGRDGARRAPNFAWDPSPRYSTNRMSFSARSPERNLAATLYADPASEPFAQSLTSTSPRCWTFNRAARNTKDAFLAHVERTPGVCYYRNAAPPPPKVAGGTIPKSERWARDLKLSPEICPGPWTYRPRHHMRSNFEKTTCETE